MALHRIHFVKISHKLRCKQVEMSKKVDLRSFFLSRSYLELNLPDLALIMV